MIDKQLFFCENKPGLAILLLYLLILLTTLSLTNKIKILFDLLE